MRISDWSSDVCSSDLRDRADQRSSHYGQTASNSRTARRANCAPKDWWSRGGSANAANSGKCGGAFAWFDRTDRSKGLQTDAMGDEQSRHGRGRARCAHCEEIGRAHVCTPVTNAHLVCRRLLEKQTKDTSHTQINKT